jgi:hypothetical protein
MRIAVALSQTRKKDAVRAATLVGVQRGAVTNGEQRVCL